MRLQPECLVRRRLLNRLKYWRMSPSQREEYAASHRGNSLKRKATQGYIDDMLILNKEGLPCLPKILTLSDPA
jgi:hypothetical protein